MRILVASKFQPQWGTAGEDLGDALEQALRAAGDEVEPVRIPFDDDTASLPGQLLALRLIDLSDLGDLMIATCWPCHLLRHRRKVLWMTEHDPSLAEALPDVDREACSEARATFASSPSIQARMGRLSGRRVELLAPPTGSWAELTNTLKYA